MRRGGVLAVAVAVQGVRFGLLGAYQPFDEQGFGHADQPKFHWLPMFVECVLQEGEVTSAAWQVAQRAVW